MSLAQKGATSDAFDGLLALEPCKGTDDTENIPGYGSLMTNDARRAHVSSELKYPMIEL